MASTRLRAELCAAEQRLAAADPIMAQLIHNTGACQLGARKRDPFDTLVGSIVSQQLSVKAADTIFARLRAAAGGQPYLQPAALLQLSTEELRAVGLSRAKARYVQAVTEAQLSGELDWKAIRRADDETAITLLTRLPGVGRWTAEMLLIFQLDRLDIFAVGDLGLRRAVESLYRKGKPITDLGLKRITNRWRPVRSVASWYLWRHVDPETQTW